MFLAPLFTKRGEYVSFQAYPLNSAFMAVSILGFLFSTIYLLHRSPTWAFTLCLFFVIMFISSMVSMARADAEEEHLRSLSFHERHR